MTTAASIPENITITPITRPTNVIGKYSPYPTVVTVTMALQESLMVEKKH